jgi:hypothetical protein
VLLAPGLLAFARHFYATFRRMDIQAAFRHLGIVRAGTRTVAILFVCGIGATLVTGPEVVAIVVGGAVAVLLHFKATFA